VQLTSGLTPQADIIAGRRMFQKCQKPTSAWVDILPDLPTTPNNRPS